MYHAIQFHGKKGGVGKDLCAEGVAQAALLRGLSPRLIEIESSKRLALLYPDAVPIIHDAPSPASLYENPDVVFHSLDEAALIWRTEALSITSFGANLTGAFVEWGRSQGSEMLNAGAGIVAAVVLTMNRHALAAGLTDLYEIGSAFPAARRIAVLNDVHSSFIEGDKFLARRLEEARGTGAAIETIHIKRCAAPAWGYAQNLGSIAEIARFEPKQLIDLGLPEGPVMRSKALITSWIADDLIAPLSVLLPEPEERKRRRSE